MPDVNPTRVHFHRENSMSDIELYIGNRATGVAVRADNKWPGMWRIHGKGRVSDMVNLTCAKDAAITWALEGKRGLRPGEKVYWQSTGGIAADAVL